MQSFKETLTTTSLSLTVVTSINAYRLRFTCQISKRNVAGWRFSLSCLLQFFDISPKCKCKHSYCAHHWHKKLRDWLNDVVHNRWIATSWTTRLKKRNWSSCYTYLQQLLQTRSRSGKNSPINWKCTEWCLYWRAIEKSKTVWVVLNHLNFEYRGKRFLLTLFENIFESGEKITKNLIFVIL